MQTLYVDYYGACLRAWTNCPDGGRGLSMKFYSQQQAKTWAKANGIKKVVFTEEAKQIK